ncbi:MAG TPA: hypothetical protein DEG23_03210 [Coxiellaceae bacterium]|nr:hypothetical protein [Coxiellaceae bacterium]HBY55806.1 hypothetical protein [Coxiellaceae bacterium]
MAIWRKVNIFLAIFSHMQVDAWSNYRRFATSFFIGILILVFGYGSDIVFLQRKLKLTQKQIVMTRELMQRKKQQVQQDKFNQQEADFKHTTKPDELKPGFEVINILNSLEKAIFEAQVEPFLFEPQAIRENEFLVVYPIKVEINGGYKNLIMFINNLLKLPYSVIIEEMDLQKKIVNNLDSLNLRVLLAVHKNKKIKVRARSTVNKPALSIQIPQRDIFKQLNRRKNLYLWSSKELRFLGLIKQGQKTFGIVSDPLGGIHRVVVGDKIGLNQSQIMAIDKRGIVTTKQVDNIYCGE